MSINDFLVKLFGSSDSQKEFEQIEHWKNEGLENAKGLQEMLLINEQASNLNDYKSFDVEAALMNNMKQLENETPVEPNSNSSLRRNLLVILSVLALSFAAYFVFNSMQEKEAIFYAENAGIKLIKNGSSIHLNENSFYTFNNDENLLKLNGEAHFDVSPQKKPFVIETEHGNITVLGTKFNVKTNADETLIYMHEGLVEFSNKTEKVKLKKGDFLQVNERLVVNQEMNSQVISYWINEKLEYKNVALTNVLDDLNRLYNKRLKAVNVNADEIFITSSFEGNSLDEIILILETIANVTIE